MSHNLAVFVLLYGLSFVPMLWAYRYKSRDAQWGLAIIDSTLTIVSYIFLARVIGWWLVPFIIVMIGVGRLMKAAHLEPYTNLNDPKS